MEVKFIDIRNANLETMDFQITYDSYNLKDCNNVPKIGEKLVWKFKYGSTTSISKAIIKDVLHLSQLGSYEIIVLFDEFETIEIESNE